MKNRESSRSDMILVAMYYNFQDDFCGGWCNEEQTIMAFMLSRASHEIF